MRRRLRRIGLAGDDGRQRRGAAAATAGAAAPLEAVLALTTILRFRELAAACAARASSEPMEQLDGIAVGLRGCPRPIEWSKERQDGDQEQEHEVGQCDSVVEFFNCTYGFSILITSTVPMIKTKSWMLELLACDEYCRFDTSAFFMRIKQCSLYTHKESRGIKTAIFIES